MNCENIYFSEHAIRRMFERKIDAEEVIEIISKGEVIVEYPDDQPYPSSLLLGFFRGRPLHVVAGMDDQTKTCYIITVYEPEPELWESGFRKRRKS